MSHPSQGLLHLTSKLYGNSISNLVGLWMRKHRHNLKDKNLFSSTSELDPELKKKIDPSLTANKTIYDKYSRKEEFGGIRMEQNSDSAKSMNCLI